MTRHSKPSQNYHAHAHSYNEDAGVKLITSMIHARQLTKLYRLPATCEPVMQHVSSMSNIHFEVIILGFSNDASLLLLTELHM